MFNDFLKFFVSDEKKLDELRAPIMDTSDADVSGMDNIPNTLDALRGVPNMSLNRYMILSFNHQHPFFVYFDNLHASTSPEPPHTAPDTPVDEHPQSDSSIPTPPPLPAPPPLLQALTALESSLGQTFPILYRQHPQPEH
jgi:hypothetical protein